MSAETRDDEVMRHELARRRRDLLVVRLGWTVDVLERKGRRYSELAADVAALLPDLPSRGASQVGVDLRVIALAGATLGLGLGLRVLRERRERNRARLALGSALGWFAAPATPVMMAWRVVQSVGPMFLVMARDAVRCAARLSVFGSGARVIESRCGEMARSSRQEAPE